MDITEDEGIELTELPIHSKIDLGETPKYKFTNFGGSDGRRKQILDFGCYRILPDKREED